MNSNDTHGFGVLLVDGSDAVVFASGAAAHPEMQARLLADLGEVRGQGAGMFAIEAEVSAVATYRVLGETVLFLLQRSDARSPLLEFVASVDFADAIFNQLLENPYTAMIVVDRDGIIRFLPEAHEQTLGVGIGGAVGRYAAEVIPNSRLHEVARSGKAEVGKLWEFNGTTRVVSRIPIRKGNVTVGAISQIMFKEPETVHDLSREVARLRTEVEFYRKELSAEDDGRREFEQMVGTSDAMRQLKSDLLKVAPLEVPVLIVGESGTGKELAAQAIHALSPRRENRMVVVNAAAIPGSLVEAELFGYESGSFTGAEKGGRRGKFELARDSSLFFDEMGDMPSEIQVKLLRVLQDGMFERVGGQRICHSDFRLICASNRNFQEMIANGQFRLDLYYRISGVTIRMPSLRERLEDIPLLVERFLIAFAKRHRTAVKSVGPGVYDFLREHSWPGNVRQLAHEVEKAAIFCDGPEITIDSFRLMAEMPAAYAGYRPTEDRQGDAAPAGPGIRHGGAGTPQEIVSSVSAGGPRKIQEAVEVLEKSMIHDAMTRHRGNKSKVAEELGISRAYLYKKLPAE
ncbi:sigma-54-dependent Fis family transcriptional regulator [Cupriavidus sp. IK-TO18]|uniref:sigma-54 interaction domain-containing protein n=1 Tax=Cupriavidus sp. IK-TO18 TaxID=2782182 RepID=UPI001899AFCA|nr:sigma 54-interacting transcriptional regulator [Cupriavidus sp. IK-TO18]MBF6990828.1 sigma 54-interacting transcriptional regulator [Cupriavidus sp. IK-TO18]